MMRNHKIYVSVLCVLALAGCQKDGLENQGMSDGAVKYAVVMDDDTQTKGTLVNTDGSDKALSEFATAIGNKFAARAFEGSGSTPIITQDVEWKTDKWVGTPVAYWPQATSLTFLASANLPESEDVAKVSYASTGVTLDYKAVPEAASAQKDILLGHYQGNGGNTGTAQIHFEHPLTAVRFLYGEIDGSPRIKSITLEGVAASGTATMDVSGAITWTGVSGYTHTVSHTDASGLNVDETTKLIGEPFIIIPQDLEGHNVTLTVILSTDNGDVTVTATINAGEWKAGFTNTYRISSEALTTLTVLVDDRVSGNVKDNLSVSNAGNCDAYIRATLVGNWKNRSGEIIECWDETQGTFDDFPGTDWIKIDGFYYYKNPVDKSAGSGAYTEIESRLFSSYTAPEPPEPDASLDLDIIVQGVKYDALKKNVTEAWGSAVADKLIVK